MTTTADLGNTPPARHARTGTDNVLAPPIHPALRDAGKGLLLRGLANVGGVLGVSVFLGCAALPVAHAMAWSQPAQQASVPAAEAPAQAASAPLAGNKLPVAPPKFSYVDGQLSISALNTTLGEVLAKVASLTGVKIEVPPAANGERMPFVELGPGTAREVLADLLSESNFDYLLAASETDPDRIQSVLIMTREKGAGRAGRVEVASRSPRSPYARSAAPVESVEAAAPESPALPSSSGTASPDAANSNPQSAAPPPDPSTQPVLAPGQSNVPKTFPVPLPTTLDSPTISQQLQQMYQQRAQMNQQTRQTGSATPPNN